MVIQELCLNEAVACGKPLSDFARKNTRRGLVGLYAGAHACEHYYSRLEPELFVICFQSRKLEYWELPTPAVWVLRVGLQDGGLRTQNCH